MSNENGTHVGHVTVTLDDEEIAVLRRALAAKIADQDRDPTLVISRGCRMARELSPDQYLVLDWGKLVDLGLLDCDHANSLTYANDAEFRITSIGRHTLEAIDEAGEVRITEIIKAWLQANRRDDPDAHKSKVVRGYARELDAAGFTPADVTAFIEDQLKDGVGRDNKAISLYIVNRDIARWKAEREAADAATTETPEDAYARGCADTERRFQQQLYTLFYEECGWWDQDRMPPPLSGLKAVKYAFSKLDSKINLAVHLLDFAANAYLTNHSERKGMIRLIAALLSSDADQPTEAPSTDNGDIPF